MWLTIPYTQADIAMAPPDASLAEQGHTSSAQQIRAGESSQVLLLLALDRLC